MLIVQEKLENVGKCRLEGNALAPSRDIEQHCIALGEKECKGEEGGCVLKVFSLQVEVLYSKPPWDALSWNLSETL